jgi:hypothetical protein
VRADDLPFPSIVLDDVPELDGWPIRPVIAIGDGTGGWVDATCSLTGLEVTVGPADDHFDLPATHLIVALDNRDGRWSRFMADGAPADYGPGTPIAVWALTPTGVGYWVFCGTIARNDQAADDTVTIEAFDAFADLAQPVGEITVGTTGDFPDERVTAILAAAGRSDLPTRLATGLNTLVAVADDASPLDQLERAVSSDGGVIWVDPDGTVVSLDRHWRNGRDDQTWRWVITDNVCDMALDASIWDPIISTIDDAVADRVVLQNTGGLTSTAGSGGHYVFTETDQLWQTQGDGDDLAAFLFNDQRTIRLRLEQFTLHLFDPNQPQLFQAVDWRLADRLVFVHRQRVVGGTEVVAVEVLIDAIHHAVTVAGGWRMTVGSSRATPTHITFTYWDTTAFTWDDPDPTNVWS